MKRHFVVLKNLSNNPVCASGIGMIEESVADDLNDYPATTRCVCYRNRDDRGELGEDYLLLFLLLHSLQSIWQLSAMVRPPSTHGVIWSASICSIS